MLNEDEIEKNLGINSLGVLPLIRGLESDADIDNLAFSAYIRNPTSSFSEAIRSVRTSLTLQGANKGVKRYMVTSVDPSEGKTTLALCLSASFGQMKKVLIIDCDLRRPSLEKALSNTHRKMLGLSDVLAGATSIDDCLVKHEELNVSFLSAGSRTLNPLELLSSSEFTLMLNDLSNQFDIIILDTPPCLAVSDAYVVGAQVDRVVFVIKAEQTKVPSIRKVINRFRTMDIEFAGALLNQVDFESRYASRSYGYYYHNYRDEERKEEASAVGVS